jgi:hypothetical protein
LRAEQRVGQHEIPDHDKRFPGKKANRSTRGKEVPLKSSIQPLESTTIIHRFSSRRGPPPGPVFRGNANAQGDADALVQAHPLYIAMGADAMSRCRTSMVARCESGGLWRKSDDREPVASADPRATALR